MKSFEDMYRESVGRVDSWVNAVTGLGSVAKDKTKSMFYGREGRISDETLDAMYAEDYIAAKIVEAVPETAFRQGINLRTSTDIGQEEVSAWTSIIRTELGRLNAHDSLFRAAVWGRLFGRGVVIIGADDGRMPHEPLGNSVRSIYHLSVTDKRDLVPSKFDNDLMSSSFGEVETYRLQSVIGGRTGFVAGSDPRAGVTEIGMEIHASRLIVFGGALTSNRERQRNNHCDNSVLLRVRDAMRQHASDWQSVSNMMSDASQGIIKINDFYGITAGGMKEAFRERLEMMTMARFVGRILPIDTNEDFEYAERSFSGIPDLLDRSMLRLSAATSIPVTVLFGRSPAGMNATGESDIANWYSVVGSHQTQKYGPQYDRLVQIIASVVGAPEPASWKVSWPSLWQQSPQEDAATKKAIGETDKIYIESGVLDADEVGMARFGSGEWSDAAPAMDTSLRMISAPGKQDPNPNPKEEEPRRDARLDSWDREFLPEKIRTDLMALEQLAVSGAPSELLREIMVRLATSMGVGTHDIIDSIGRWHNGASGVVVRMDEYRGQAVPPLAAIDVVVFEALSRIGAPAELLRAIAQRLAINLGVATEDVMQAIDKHSYTWIEERVPGVIIDVVVR